MVEVEAAGAEVGADVARDDEGDEAGCSCAESSTWKHTQAAPPGRGENPARLKLAIECTASRNREIEFGSEWKPAPVRVAAFSLIGGAADLLRTGLIYC